MFCPWAGLSPPSDRSDPRQPKVSSKRHGLWKVVFSPPKLGYDSHVEDPGTKQVDIRAQREASTRLSWGRSQRPGPCAACLSQR